MKKKIPHRSLTMLTSALHLKLLLILKIKIRSPNWSLRGAWFDTPPISVEEIRLIYAKCTRAAKAWKAITVRRLQHLSANIIVTHGRKIWLSHPLAECERALPLCQIGEMEDKRSQRRNGTQIICCESTSVCETTSAHLCVCATQVFSSVKNVKCAYRTQGCVSVQ